MPQEEMNNHPKAIKGRGSQLMPANRFEQIHLERDEEYDPSEAPSPKTQFFNDTTKSIISYSDSPDLGPIASINAYRGCEHGCIYCYARPYHEYLGMSAGIDFETKIFVKPQAPELLRKELSSHKWQPKVLMMSGVTDCYQPAERRFQLTRRCLEVLAEFRNPICIITKNRLVTRDVDVLKQLHEYQCAAVTLSLTSLDAKLAQKMEPRTSQPANRLKAIEELNKAGIPVGVNIAPIIPGLTDEEIPRLIKSAVDAGAAWAGLTIVRLPYAVKDLFAQWLEDHFPNKKNKVLGHIREVRGGKLYDANWKTRMKGDGAYAEAIQALFKVSAKKYNLPRRFPDLARHHFKNTDNRQLSFF